MNFILHRMNNESSRYLYVCEVQVTLSKSTHLSDTNWKFQFPPPLVPDACGGILDTPNGTLTSPSFPDLYIKNKTCIWEIVAPPQYRISLNFTHFDIEGNNVSVLPFTEMRTNFRFKNRRLLHWLQNSHFSLL